MTYNVLSGTLSLYTTTTNPNLPLHKSAECTRLLFLQLALQPVITVFVYTSVHFKHNM